MTDDVLRSLAVSVHVLRVDSVIVMQHTRCGLFGVSDDELRARAGADLDFLAIADHTAALGHDIDVLSTTEYLHPLRAITGFVYDVESGEIDDAVRGTRAPSA